MHFALEPSTDNKARITRRALNQNMCEEPHRTLAACANANSYVTNQRTTIPRWIQRKSLDNNMSQRLVILLSSRPMLTNWHFAKHVLQFAD